MAWMAEVKIIWKFAHLYNLHLGGEDSNYCSRYTPSILEFYNAQCNCRPWHFQAQLTWYPSPAGWHSPNTYQNSVVWNQNQMLVFQIGDSIVPDRMMLSSCDNPRQSVLLECYCSTAKIAFLKLLHSSIWHTPNTIYHGDTPPQVSLWSLKKLL